MLRARRLENYNTYSSSRARPPGPRPRGARRPGRRRLGDASAAGVWRERGPNEKAEEAGGGPGEGDDDGPSEIARSGRHSWLADRPGVGTELGGRQYVTRRVSMYDGGSAARMPHSKRALTVPVSHFFSSL